LLHGELRLNEDVYTSDFFLVYKNLLKIKNYFFGRFFNWKRGFSNTFETAESFKLFCFLSHYRLRQFDFSSSGEIQTPMPPHQRCP